MNTNGKRKWSAADKLRIVILGMDPTVSVSELCRREGISANHFYLWKKQLLSSASKIFDAKAGRPSADEAKKEAELARLKDVVVEITTENLELKKGLSV
jgi:transposase-like protein